MEEKQLYPLSLCTILDEYKWGNEEFKLADLGYRDSLVKDGWLAGNSLSEIMDTYMDRVTGDSCFDYYGRQFPFQIKTLECKGRMPLRVHPDDEIAAQRYDLLGKEKLWYIQKAGKDAVLYLGFKQDTDGVVFFDKCNDGTVDTLLNGVAVHPGQSFLIKPGTVHATKGDVTIVEVSESSPADFCLCSWGQELGEEEFDPAFDLVEALDIIDYKAYTAAKAEDCIHFAANFINLDKPMAMDTEASGACVAYYCLKGRASVQMSVLGSAVNFFIGEGETILVPSDVSEYIISPAEKNTEVLEAFPKTIKSKNGWEQ